MKTKIDKDFETRLLLLLTARQLITNEQADAAHQSKLDIPERYLIDQGILTRDQLAEVAAESFGLNAISSNFRPLQEVLSHELSRIHQVVPVEVSGDTLVVAAALPGSPRSVEELAKASGCRIRFLITDRLTLAEKLAAIGPVSPEPVSENEDDPSSLIGGRYRLLDRFLDGRFSILYFGKDELAGMPVLIRHLESYFSSEDARMQTLREGLTLAKLRHPNLPRIRQLVQHDDDIFLIADEISGRCLSEEIEHSGAFEPELVRRYLKQLLQVVDYLHSQPQPIIHRDLRPSSILVTPNGNLRLAEFGLAKMGEASTGAAQTSFRSAGDPNFASPEQILGDASSTRNDIYSVGALAYYMSTGHPPEPSLKRFSSEPSRPELPQSLDHTVQEVIALCLEPKPENRPESAKELLAKLQVHEIRLPMLLLAPPPMPAPPTMPRATNGSEAPEMSIAKTPDEQKAPAPVEEQAATSKRSMWQLLFGRRKQKSGWGLPQETDEHKALLHSVPFADLAAMDLDRDICRILPESLSRNIGGICIGRLSETEITVACKDPTDVHIYDSLSMVSHGSFKPTLLRADPDVIEYALEYVYRGEHLDADTAWSKFLELKRLDNVAIVTTNEQAMITFGDEALEGPVVESVDRLIKEAIAAEASDIHLEPFDTGMDIRYRIDGVLRVVAHHEKSVASSIVKRIKVMANMDIAQERVTQGGRISLKVGSQEFDLRVSVVPVPAGESVVMRILKKGAFTLTLGDLGFSSENERRFRTILSQPHGMILVCGPTGSGKSTTLYASLKEIQRPDRKLLTAEDPIEYQMPGIIQVQVNTAPREEEKRVTFSKALREFLRQDPDVILVGEIRDRETAEIGIQAALTGHLLLSTLHTNDSVGIIARLRDMDCEPFQIGSVLLAGLAQRLARKVCQECKEPVELLPEMLPLFESKGLKNPMTFQGRGCRVCHQSGHKGRVGLYELLEITPEIRSLINRGAQEEDIRETALSQGFKDLLSDGLEKVCEGLVSLEEVLRVCKTV